MNQFNETLYVPLKHTSISEVWPERETKEYLVFLFHHICVVLIFGQVWFWVVSSE